MAAIVARCQEKIKGVQISGAKRGEGLRGEDPKVEGFHIGQILFYFDHLPGIFCTQGANALHVSRTDANLPSKEQAKKLYLKTYPTQKCATYSNSVTAHVGRLSCNHRTHGSAAPCPRLGGILSRRYCVDSFLYVLIPRRKRKVT